MRMNTLVVWSAAILMAACGTQGGKKNSGGEPPPETGTGDAGSDDPESGPGDPGGTQPATEQPDTNPTAQNPKPNPPPKTPTKPNPPPPVTPTPPPVTPTPPPNPYGQQVEATQDSIQKLLVNHYCLPCHQGENAAGGLNLTDIGVYASGDLGAGGYRGIFIYPGRPEISAFKLVLKDHQGEQVMPPAENALGIPAVLPQQIDAVTAWIQALEGEGDPGRP